MPERGCDGNNQRKIWICNELLIVCEILLEER
jgi:hypothetical protein